MSYRFIYDAAQEEEVNEKVLPLINEFILNKASYKEVNQYSFTATEKILVYLSDTQIKELLPVLAQTGATLAVLPHPDAGQACTGLGINLRLEKAVKHLKEQQEAIEADILYCNDKPVFNKIVLGDSFHLTEDMFAKSNTWFQRLKAKFKQVFRMRPFLLDITLKDKKQIQTAVSGVVIIQHKKSSLFSRMIPTDSSIQDGMFHVFLISPRSIMELVAFAVSSIWKKNRLPEFAGYIKTGEISFSRDDTGIEFNEDDKVLSAQKLELTIKKKHIKVIPGAYFETSEEKADSNEIVKVSSLPSGEAAESLSGKTLPLLRHASTDEFKDLFQILRENAHLKNSFLVLMVLSTTLATLGLFANSSPVVIGAMILAPLMAPIISLSMATLRQDRKLAVNSVKTIFAGLGISLIFAVIFTLVTPIKTPNAEILARIRPNILDLGIAVISGIAGAYAHARAEIAKTLAGVAIAVALVPPLAVTGIGIGWADWDIFSGAALLLITNFGGMVLAGSVTFMLLGFSPLRLATKGIIISLITVVLLSIPLAFSFNRMIDEHRLIQQLDGWESSQAVIREVKVQRLSPLTLSIKIVSAKTLETNEIDDIQTEIEEKLNRKVILEITPALSRERD